MKLLTETGGEILAGVETVFESNFSDRFIEIGFERVSRFF